MCRQHALWATTSAVDKPRNHAVWLGALLALFGLGSHFALFAGWPITHDVPWLSFALLALALSTREHLAVRPDLSQPSAAGSE